MRKYYYSDMDKGDRVIIMNHPDRPDLTGLQGVIVSRTTIGGTEFYRIRVHGFLLSETFTGQNLCPHKPERRRK